MDAARPGPGLREAIIVWAIWATVLVTAFVTYTRLPARDFYNVTGSGLTGGAARVVVLVGWPISIAVPALLALAADRLLAQPLASSSRRVVVVTALVSALLCATIAWPGVIQQSDLDAKWSNSLAVIGVALAVALTVAAIRRAGTGQAAPRGRGDRIAIGVVIVYAFAAIPWMLANLGVYAGDVPGVSHVFMSKQILPEPGHPTLRAVHLGNHEGLDGWLLVVTAILLRPVLPWMRPTRLRPIVGGYLALMLGYGAFVTLNDVWNEQLVKRGWTSRNLPSVLSPSISWGWLALILVAVAAYLLAFRVRPTSRAPAATPA